MSGLFIDVSVDDAIAGDTALAAKLAEVCPVDIFAVADDGRLQIKDENLDECVLCRLCLNAAEQAGAAGGVRVVKLYEDDPELAVLR
ncbi:MAG TPA: hypothetical protein VFR49_07385 [Solirubrobacteraceae bacterium]|nr:hypothetical protein [Solirubrobacteraceae bacterium]